MGRSQGPKTKFATLYIPGAIFPQLEQTSSLVDSEPPPNILVRVLYN